MILIVGLGNPGKKYEKTRHNIGFLVVDEFTRKNDFPDFKLAKKINSLITEDKFNNKKIILAKPRTFMNNSGKAVKALIKNLKLEIENLIVIHDDIDLPLGKIRISKNRGAAGHKGVESIIKELRTPKDFQPKFGGGLTGQAKNFVRFRIGIQPKSGKPNGVERFVLQKFKKEEKKIVKKAIQKTIEAMEFALREGLEKAMSKFNK